MAASKIYKKLKRDPPSPKAPRMNIYKNDLLKGILSLFNLRKISNWLFRILIKIFNELKITKLFDESHKYGHLPMKRNDVFFTYIEWSWRKLEYYFKQNMYLIMNKLKFEFIFFLLNIVSIGNAFFC